MAKSGYDQDFYQFWNDMQGQDDNSQMYKTADKFFEMLQMTDYLSNLQEGASKLMD